VYVGHSMPTPRAYSAVALFAATLLFAPAAAAQVRASRRPVPLPTIPASRGALQVRVVYPPAGSLVTARDSTFVFGSVGNGLAHLAIDGHPVAVAPNGAFLAFIPLPSDTAASLRVVATLGADSAVLVQHVRLPARPVVPARALWIDGGSAEPRGERWAEAGEPIRVSVRAAPGAAVSVRLPDGRLFPLAPDTLRESSPGTFERQAPRPVAPPALRYRGAFPAAADAGTVNSAHARRIDANVTAAPRIAGLACRFGASAGVRPSAR